MAWAMRGSRPGTTELTNQHTPTTKSTQHDSAETREAKLVEGVRQRLLAQMDAMTDGGSVAAVLTSYATYMARERTLIADSDAHP